MGGGATGAGDSSAHLASTRDSVSGGVEARGGEGVRSVRRFGGDRGRAHARRARSLSRVVGEGRGAGGVGGRGTRYSNRAYT